MNPSELSQRFQDLFGARPRIFRAPGRVNLIGEHTDYNDGFVMPAAVGFSTYAAIAARSDQKLILRSDEFAGDFEFDLEHLPSARTGSWCDYPLGVALSLRRLHLNSCGADLRGANILAHGEVPIGAGLSSSAAIEVASALALMSVNQIEIPMPEVAKLCRQAENDFVGAHVGIMDQFVSCMAEAQHALLLDCRSLDFTLAPIPSGIRLVVCNTMVKHDVATSAYNERRQQCEEGVRYFARINPSIHALRDVSERLLDQHADHLPTVIANRCTHVVHENQRTLAASRALAEGNLPHLGKLMRESHRSLRDLYEVSCRELDIMVDSAEGLPGFIGGRMTGGGFGGCTINLVHEAQANDFAARVAERYRTSTGIDPQVYLCAAEDGAEEVIV